METKSVYFSNRENRVLSIIYFQIVDCNFKEVLSLHRNTLKNV